MGATSIWQKRGKHAKWVFSGVGVAVPIALVSWLFFGESDPAPSVSADSSGISAGGDMNVTGGDGGDVTLQTGNGTIHIRKEESQ